MGETEPAGGQAGSSSRVHGREAAYGDGEGALLAPGATSIKASGAARSGHMREVERSSQTPGPLPKGAFQGALGSH